MLLVVLGFVFALVIAIGVRGVVIGYRYAKSEVKAGSDPMPSVYNKDAMYTAAPAVGLQALFVAIGWLILLHRGIIGWWGIHWWWLMLLSVLITGTAFAIYAAVDVACGEYEWNWLTLPLVLVGGLASYVTIVVCLIVLITTYIGIGAAEWCAYRYSRGQLDGRGLHNE